jgi:hypothetical protein
MSLNSGPPRVGSESGEKFVLCIDELQITGYKNIESLKVLP